MYMKKRLIITLAAVFAAVLVIGAVVAAVLLFGGDTILHYDFDSDAGKLSERLKGGASIVEGAGIDGAGLVLDGSSGYLELPSGILRDEMSLVVWLKRDSCSGYERLFDFGSGSDNYFAYAPTFGSVVLSVNGDDKWTSLPIDKTVDEWQMFAMVADNNTYTFYIDGEQIGDPFVADYTLSQVSDDENYIGYSRRGDPYLCGTIDDLTIYKGALSGGEVLKMYEDALVKQRLIEDANALAMPQYTYGDLTLDTTGGVNGFEISWRSSDKGVLSEQGKVSPKNSDKSVTLTAVISDPDTGISYERDFTVTVVASGASGRLNFVKNMLDVGIEYITNDISLASEIDGVQISWDGGGYLSADGRIMRPESDTQFTLTATLSYEGETAQKEFELVAAAKTYAYLATYISVYEYNTGVEFAEYPSHDYTDNARTDVMFYAVSTDGENFEGINNDRAVLYPRSDNCVMGVPFEYKFGSPMLFRKPDGTYGLVAANDNTTSQVLIYDTADLINFENQREIDLGRLVCDPWISYDNESGLYTLSFESDDGSYACTSGDLITFSEPYACEYEKPAFEGNLPVYASSADAALFELTYDEYDRLMKKYGGLYSVSVDYTDEMTASVGKSITLPETATVNYNDGSTKDMGIIWDAEAAGLDLDNPQAGTYTVTGKINRPVYVSPLAECRADPYVVYNEEDGMYYFTSSYMQADLQNAYAYVIIRRAPTINELKDAEEVIIWDSSRGQADAWYWAPELHYMGGQWRIILLSTWEDSGWEATLLSCKEGGDLLDPNNWEATGKIGADKNGMKPGAFDTTYFEYYGKCYYVTPSGNNILIAQIDPDNLLDLSQTEFIKIGGASYAWEYNNGYPGTACDHQFVNEGSSVMIHDGKIYITYAGSTIDMHYCIGLLYADLEDDLLDPDSWHKYPLPLLVTADLTTTIKEPVLDENGDTAEEGEYEGSFGPGHNSVTVDENGNPVVIYHARVWGENYVSSGEKYGLGDPGRHAFAHSINFDADGIPVMNMTAEQELSSELETVTITVTVE